MPRRVILFFWLLAAAGSAAAFDGDPFYEKTASTNQSEFFAVRPFYSSSVDPAEERARRDYFWPLYTRKDFKDERYGRFLFFGYSLNFSPETDRYRHWVLPFYFKGTSAYDENYFALFPLGGKIYEILGRDKVMFVLFPIYAKSHVNEVYTTSVLWPIYSNSKGGKVDRFRIWPLYGRSSREDEYNKKFVLWPFYNSVEYTNERNPGGGFILFPIYGRVQTKMGDSRWYIPPFFRYAKSENQWIVNAPWPFIQMAGGDVHKRVVWPLYGKKRLGINKSQYYLWPIIWHNETDYIEYIQHRRFVVPFFSSSSRVISKPDGMYEKGDISSRRWKIWPLMSWQRNHEDSQFRFLELWPWPNPSGIERNWAPLWTLYRRENNSGQIGHHILWGLYRQSKGEEAFEWSLLKGIAGYKKTEIGRSYRFLFMKFGEEESP
jgi:hypothetical protein